MVLMSGDSFDKSENLESEKNPASVSSDSGISNCSKEDVPSGGGGGGQQRDKSESPRSQSQQSGQEEEDNVNSTKDFFRRGPRRSFGSNRGDYSSFFEDDPFFSDKANKFFNNSNSKSKFGNRPRLSERVFGNRKGHQSVFDNDHFVDDLRRRIQEEKKMFFDGSSDPFASFGGGGGGGRPTSPVGGGAGRTGFPFEDLRSGARARFDEFANRHPTMFSTMRNQPAWMDDPFGHHHHHGFQRERHNSGSSGGGSGGSGSGEERVIPIHIIRDDSPKREPQQQTRGKSPAPPAPEPARIVREASPKLSTPPGPQRCNTEPNHPNIGEETRSTRAQSAPPVGNDVFAAKVAGEKNDSKPQTTQMGGNCSKTPKTEHMPTANGGARSIPIVIEGRKIPVNAANMNGSFSSGQSPPQPKVSRPAERSPTPPPKKPAPPKDPLAQVNAVLEEVKELEKQVDDFKGNSREDREYLVLDEMLTRCLIKLDVVETEGRDDVRTARKDCIRYIQSCISKLEKKASQPGGQPMETGSQDAKAETDNKNSAEQKMDIDTNNTCASEGKVNQPPGGADNQPVNA